MPTAQVSPFSTVDSWDLDHCHAQPGNWNVQATQLGRGVFRSQIRSLKFTGLTVYDNKWGAASLIRGKAPDGVLMLGGVHKRSPIVHWCGEVPDQSRFACTAGGKEIEFSVEKGVHDVVLLLDRLGRCFSSTRGAAEQPPTESVRKRAFRAAINHVTATILQTSALTMAKAAGVSQKTLEVVFMEQLGMTPARYLKTARLNLAHQQLSEADPVQMTVTDIAMHCGFSHTGRFSAEYRMLFGEFPSETLAKG